MSGVRAQRALLIVAAVIAAVVCASTATAAGPIRLGGDPRDPTGPVKGEVLPTPVETAAQALMALLEENPSASRGGVAVAEDRKSVVVYWKGDPPASVKSFAAGQPVPVVFRGAAYSQAELMAAAWSLLEENKGVVTSAGPSSDYSGVAIGLSSKVPAPEAAVAALKAHAAVPIEFIGIEDIKPLASRNADRYPW